MKKSGTTATTKTKTTTTGIVNEIRSVDVKAIKRKRRVMLSVSNELSDPNNDPDSTVKPSELSPEHKIKKIKSGITALCRWIDDMNKLIMSENRKCSTLEEMNDLLETVRYKAAGIHTAMIFNCLNREYGLGFQSQQAVVVNSDSVWRNLMNPNSNPSDPSTLAKMAVKALCVSHKDTNEAGHLKDEPEENEWMNKINDENGAWDIGPETAGWECTKIANFETSVGMERRVYNARHTECAEYVGNQLSKIDMSEIFTVGYSMMNDNEIIEFLDQIISIWEEKANKRTDKITIQISSIKELCEDTEEGEEKSIHPESWNPAINPLALIKNVTYMGEDFFLQVPIPKHMLPLREAIINCMDAPECQLSGDAALVSRFIRKNMWDSSISSGAIKCSKLQYIFYAARLLANVDPIEKAFLEIQKQYH